MTNRCLAAVRIHPQNSLFGTLIGSYFSQKECDHNVNVNGEWYRVMINCRTAKKTFNLLKETLVTSRRELVTVDLIVISIMIICSFC